MAWLHYLETTTEHITDNIKTYLIFCEIEDKELYLTGKFPSLSDVNAWAAQGSTINILLSLIYMHNLADDLSNVRLFVDDTSLFSAVHYVSTSAGGVSNDLINEFMHW